MQKEQEQWLLVLNFGCAKDRNQQRAAGQVLSGRGCLIAYRDGRSRPEDFEHVVLGFGVNREGVIAGLQLRNRDRQQVVSIQGDLLSRRLSCRLGLIAERTVCGTTSHGLEREA